MIKNLTPFVAQGEIEINSSKSFAHRYVILACLSSGKTILKNVGNSVDILATIGCMQRLGAKIEYDGLNAIVYGIENFNKEIEVDFLESGSTMRFLIPIFSVLGVKTKFTGRGKLLERPNDALYSALNKKGVKIENNQINGKLQGGKFNIDATISSQYISGLLMAFTLINEDCTVNLVGNLVSKNYLDITLSALKDFGVDCIVNENSITINKNSKLKSKGFYQIEGDWSSACFPIVLGLLGKKVIVNGLNPNSLQGDKKVVEILQNAGANLQFEEGKLIAQNSQIKGLRVDIKDIPDSAPILAVLMATLKGKSTMLNVDRLKIKESDRLLAIIENLKKACIQTEYSNNQLTVFGGKIKGANFLGYNDHRIVMAFSVLASIANGNSTITDMEAVSKSYKNFFEDLTKLGG